MVHCHDLIIKYWYVICIGTSDNEGQLQTTHHPAPSFSGWGFPRWGQAANSWFHCHVLTTASCTPPVGLPQKWCEYPVADDTWRRHWWSVSPPSHEHGQSCGHFRLAPKHSFVTWVTAAAGCKGRPFSRLLLDFLQHSGQSSFFWSVVTGTELDDFSIGNAIIPIDEVIFFQRGRLNHQPVFLGFWFSCCFLPDFERHQWQLLDCIVLKTTHQLRYHWSFKALKRPRQSTWLIGTIAFCRTYGPASWVLQGERRKNNVQLQWKQQLYPLHAVRLEQM